MYLICLLLLVIGIYTYYENHKENNWIKFINITANVFYTLMAVLFVYLVTMLVRTYIL